MGERLTRTPGERKRFERLLAAARSEFGDTISPAEKRLMRACVVGEVANFTDTDYKVQLWESFRRDASDAKAGRPLAPRPDPPASLRAEVMIWLLTNKLTKSWLHPSGVRMIGVRLDDRVSIRNSVIHSAVWIQGSRLAKGIDLAGSSTRDVFLNGSWLSGDPDERECESAVYLDGCAVAGSLFLREGFRADSEVRMIGAEIASTVMLDGATIPSESGDALSFDHAVVRHDLHLAGGLVVDGTVRLVGTKLGGNLSFRGSTIRSRSGLAIVADGIAIQGNVFIDQGVSIGGEVRFVGGTIGRALICNGVGFVGGVGTVLSLDSALVRGTLFIHGFDSCEGRIDMTRSRIAYLHDGEGTESDAPLGWARKTILSDCQYEGIFARAPLDASRRLAWLSRHDDTMNAAVIDPQPYRWLAEVMKKQGHEDDARVVLRTCAERRVPGLARQAEVYGRENPAKIAGFFGVAWLVAGGLAWSAGFMGSFGAWAWCAVFAFGLLAGFLLLAGSPQRAGFFERWRVKGTSWLYRWVFGFGYARWRALGWLGGLLLLGTVALDDHSKPVPGGLMQPTQARAIQDWNQGKEWTASLPSYNAFFYSADALIPLVSLHQEEYWTPSTATTRGWIVKNVYLPLHIAAGWVIATLFVASFTRLMRQEG